MKFNGGRQFGHRVLTVLRRIRLLIRCDQVCRFEHANLAESLGVDSLSFLSQTLSILQGAITKASSDAVGMVLR